MEETDWNQIRINAAISAMNALLSSSVVLFVVQFLFKKQVADIAVGYADKLVEDLKK